MLFDQTGYLWLGTQNGLIRYDGINFKTYFPDQNNILSTSSNSVLSISCTPSDKTVLVRMADGFVYTIQNGRPVFYSKPVSNSPYYKLNGYFPSLALFNKFNLPASDLITEHKLNAKTMAVLPVNKTDFIALGETDNKLLYFANGIKQKEIIIDFRFRAFLKSGERNLLLDYDYNLYLYDSLSAAFIKIAIEWPGSVKEKNKNNSLTFLWDKFNDQSYLFYNSVSYLLRFDAANRVMKFIPQFSIEGDGQTWTEIIYDSINATFFLGTFTDGLFQVKLKRIRAIPPNKKIANYGTATSTTRLAILKTSDSTALTPYGIEFTSSIDRKISEKKMGNIAGNVETIAKLDDTAILCVQQNQLVYYSQSDGFRQGNVFNASFNNSYRSFITVLQPEGDSVWVCSDAGIFSLKQNNIRVLYSITPDKWRLYLGAHLFYRLSPEAILFSNNAGLFKLKTFPPYTIDSFPEMRNKQVECIVKYKDFLLLAVYKHGLFLFKDNSFKKVPLNDYQPGLAFCHSAVIDNNENVWVSTDNGLFRSSISSIIKSVSTPSETPFFFSYDEKDGIINSGFSGGGFPSYSILPNGQIFYASPGGIVTFNSEELSCDLLKTPIPVEKIQVDEKEIDAFIKDSIFLSAGFKFLGIDLSVPHFGNPENLFLEYRLDNNVWKKIPVFPSQRIMLYDIPAGYHQLQIRKRIGFGSDDYIYKKLVIYRKKYLYQQLWFFPLLAAGFILLVWLIIKWRRKNINRQRQQLQVRVNEQTSELSRLLLYFI